MFHKHYRILLSFLLVVGVLNCGQGELSLSGAGCQRASFIEGCHQYGPSSQCSACEFNYDLLNGRCDYNPKPIEKCCVQFGANGECSKCEKGLFLDKGACKQAALIGCLQKQGSACSNCADGYFLSNGQCSQGIKRCNAYKANGECTACTNGYTLSTGLCIPFSLDNCAVEANGICSKCQVPYVLNNGKCQINNCQKAGQFGCIKCSPYFYNTQQGLCAPYQAGCRTYKHGVCIDCLPNFIFDNGLCKIQGCSVQQGNVCKTCASGYKLQSNGICQIPNCLQSVQDKCLICTEGYHVSGGKCIPISANCVDFVGEVCKTCAPGFILGNDGRCVIQDPGCNKYANGLCVECRAPFIISPSGKCYIDGCDSFDASGCLKCSAPYLLSKNICRLPNCDKASNGLCSVCSTNYHLFNKQCVINDAYCTGYNANGICLGCLPNFHITDLNTCVNNQPGCVYTGSICSSCIAPFTLSSGNCRIANCKQYVINGCSVCNSGFYLASSGLCLKQQIGGIYVGGVLTGCKVPFTFNPSAQKCEIDGCTKYAVTGCTNCLSPYKLLQNICKIDNCLKAEKGQCFECNSGYKVQNGVCIRSILNCIDYNTNGCQTCANGFYLSANGDSCLPVQAGCIYSNGKCTKCSEPFSFNSGTCIIQGCSVFDVNGCKTCKSGFNLDSGRCVLPNCKTVLNGQCSICDQGFNLESGFCRATNQCVELLPNGTCKTCSAGYSTNICGRCVPSVSSCAFYGRNGKCSECINMYFLTTDFICKLRQKGCKSYVNGVCTDCETNFFLYDGICFPFTEGCLKYSGKDCVACSAGYTISRGICLKSSNKLTKGLNFDDLLSTNTNAINSTSQSVGTDIDFTSVSARNPASGAKIGTLFYSSVFSSSYNTYGINSSVGWKAGKAAAGQWAGIQVSSAQTFYELQIQAGENGAYVSELIVEFSVDGIKFEQVPGTFTINIAGNNVFSVQFVPVYAIAIRFVVKKFNVWPSARFDFIFNNIDEKLEWAGLFSTNQINKKIYALHSSRLSNQLDINIRRFFNPVRDCSDKEKCWSGIELCEPKNVTAINFPTTVSTSGAITEFYIDFSLDGNYFSCYENCTAIPVSGSKFTFKKALKAKNVRVHPTKWSGNPQVQFTFDYN